MEAVAGGLPGRFDDASQAVTLSAGIALAEGRDELSGALLARADSALSLAKAGGRGRAAWLGCDGQDIVVGGPSTAHPLHALDSAPRDQDGDRARA